MEIVELTAMIFGLTEVAKQLIPSEWQNKLIPLIAVAIGGVSNVYLVGYSPEVLMTGIVFGLTATGLYKTGKSFTKKETPPV